MEHLEKYLPYLKTLGVTLTARQLLLFEKYAALLAEWNEKFNLVANADAEEVAKRHFADSLAYACRIKSAAQVIDIGAGAGFPGVPLAIARPDCYFFAVDSVGKKTLFLDALKAELCLENLAVKQGRAEELAFAPYSFRESFDLALARAVAPLNTLAELCLPFVKVGGFFCAYKNADINNEAMEAAHALQILGGAPCGRFNYAIDGVTRAVLEYEKVKITPEKYPRAANKAKLSPIR